MKNIFLIALLLSTWNSFAEPVTHARRVESGHWTPEVISKLQVAPGYSIQVFASGLENPRGMVVDEKGMIYVSRPEHGDILTLQKENDKIVKKTFLSGYSDVSGMALHKGKLYFIAVDKVYVVDLSQEKPSPKVLYKDLPEPGQHPKRTIGIGPDGYLYINIGSTCNACKEENAESATLLRASLNGSGRRIFAKGLRNTQGFDWDPQTKKLYGMDHGIDMLGDDVPPEELNLLKEGGNYGWPYCYGDRQPNPQLEADKNACAKTIAPLLGVEAHAAPLALKFHWGSAFVALHGSWNRDPPSGFKVVRIIFEKGEPKKIENFVTGFLAQDGREQWGRPAGLAVNKEGNLLISDDSNGVIYEVKPAAQTK